MSYDLRLYWKDNRSRLLKKSEIESVENKFDLNIDEIDAQDNVVGFSAKFKENSPDWLSNRGFEVYYQKDGYYWTSLPSSATGEMFDYFQKLLEELSRSLGLYIVYDADSMEQEGSEKTIDKLYDVDAEALKKISLTPSDSQYFIKIFMISTDPLSGKVLLFRLNQNQIYCSKVNKGQTLDQVLEKEIEIITGSKDYRLLEVKDNTRDFDFDREGNKLPRIQVSVEISYFDPAERSLKYAVNWVKTY